MNAPTLLCLSMVDYDWAIDWLWMIKSGRSIDWPTLSCGTGLLLYAVMYLKTVPLQS